MNRPISIAALALCMACSVPSATGRTLTTDTTDQATILHAWCWSFDTIAANMRDIADAGYTFVQTSPANRCRVGEDGGLAIFSQPGDPVSGKWYYHYQPIEWQVGNYQLGDRESFKAMCDSARAYGVKVLVDVLPNHTATDTALVTDNFIRAAGGRDKMFHANGFKPITDWNDRDQSTSHEMGGLPDVNTENPDFQYYYLQYVNDLINLGARGFRYDTAKHIALPSDPVDPAASVNDFWPIATGRKGVKGLTLLMPDSLFIYGEVLQDKNVKEVEYSEYVDVTASNYGHVLRHALEQGSVKNQNIEDWRNPAGPSRIVTWVESHDTYCNDNESASLTDDQIRTGWILIAAREGGTPLFFSRPAGSSRQNIWGNNRIGARGNDEFRHPEVVAVNKFRTAMAGEPETIITSGNGSVIEVCRGSKGAALVNISDKTRKVDMATALPDGTYTDAVSGRVYTVSHGILTGSMPPFGSAILISAAQ